jgi:acyl-CoA hydrolase
MYETGRITNAKKARDINKSTFSFCLGTQDTYDFLDDNPVRFLGGLHHQQSRRCRHK